jgi:hypothetical protein
MRVGEANEYVPQDDEAEYKRLQDVNGVGEPVYLDPDAVREYAMGDYGMINANDGH